MNTAGGVVDAALLQRVRAVRVLIPLQRGEDAVVQEVGLHLRADGSVADAAEASFIWPGGGSAGMESQN